MSASRMFLQTAVLLTVLTAAWPSMVVSQPTQLSSQCLKAALIVEKASFKATGQYIYDEDQLRQYMSAGCASLRYEFQTKHNGFRVSAETNGETWSMDETGHLVQLVRGRSPLAPPETPTPSAGVTSLVHTPSVNGAAPSATFADDSGKPVQGASNVPLVPDGDLSTRFKVCLTKEMIATKACGALFTVIDQRCMLALKPTPKICMEFNAAITSIEVPDCKENDDSASRCELRRSLIEKRCSNPLKATMPECRWMTRYLASQGAPREPAAAAAERDTSRNNLGAKNGPAKPGDASLQKLLRLRPAPSLRKGTRFLDWGFSGKEAEEVDPSLVNYNAEGLADGVRQDQLLSLTVGAVQEVYGRCQNAEDKQKEILNRLDAIEAENSRLKLENMKLLKFVETLQNKSDLKK